MKKYQTQEIQKKELKMLLELDRIAEKNDITYYLAYGTALGAVRGKGFIPWDNDIDIVVKMDDYNKLCKALYLELNDSYTLNHIDYDKSYDSLKARVSLKNNFHLIIHIDIFPLVGMPEGNFRKRLFREISYFNYRIHFLKKLNPELHYSNKKFKRRIAKTLQKLVAFFPVELSTKIFKSLSQRYPVSKSKYVYNICGSYGKKEIIPSAWLDEPVYKEFEGSLMPLPSMYDRYLTHLYGNYMTPKKKDYV